MGMPQLPVARPVHPRPRTPRRRSTNTFLAAAVVAAVLFYGAPSPWEKRVPGL